jgi:hypothetical protein
MSENMGASNSHSLKGFHGLYRDSFTVAYLQRILYIIACKITLIYHPTFHS